MELTECGPPRSPSSSPISGDACRSRSCASPAESRATAARPPASCARRARYGLDAKGHRLELDEVLAGPFPVIVHWGFNHFLVLEGVSDTEVFLNDPATGPRRVSREEFGQKLHRRRAALCALARTSSPAARRPACWPSSATACPAATWELGIIAWLSLMLVIPGLVLPGATKAFVDDILVKRFEGWLSPLLVGLAVMFVLQVALSAVQQMALLRLELKLALEESARFTWHVLRLPVEFFNQRFAGDLANRIDSNDRVARLLARDCGQAAATCFTASFLGIVMLFYDPTLAAIAIGGAALNVGLLTLMQRVLQDIVLRLQTEMGKLYAVSVVGLQSIETLKATGTESDFFAKWTGHHARAMNSEQKLAVYQQASNLVPPLVSSLTSGRGAGRRRRAGGRGHAERRRAGRLPGPGAELFRADRPDGRHGRQGAAGLGRHHPARRRAAIPARLALLRGSRRRSRPSPPAACR